MMPLLGLLPFAEKLLDALDLSGEKKIEAKVKLLEMEQNGELAKLAADTELAKGQLEINKIEAASSNIFVAGWRPFIGWTCGVAFAYHFVLQPFLAFAISNYYNKQVILPAVDMEVIAYTLCSILGIGGTLRTAEKIKGVSK